MGTSTQRILEQLSLTTARGSLATRVIVYSQYNNSTCSVSLSSKGMALLSYRKHVRTFYVKQSPARLLPITCSCYHIADKHHNLLCTVLEGGSLRWGYQWGWFWLVPCPSCLQLLIILPQLLVVLWPSLYHKTQRGSKEPFQTLPAGSAKSSLKVLPSVT